MSHENRGIRGPKSLRINGQTVGNLPLGLGEVAKEQIPDFIQQERMNRVNAISARYPKGDRDYYKASIRECEANVETFVRSRGQTRKRMEQYQLLIRNNKGRTYAEAEVEIDEIAARHDIDINEKMALIKTAKLDVQAYDSSAMWEQIKQFQDDVERYEAAIEVERKSIALLRETIGLLDVRDREIRTVMTELIEVS